MGRKADILLLHSTRINSVAFNSEMPVQVGVLKAMEIAHAHKMMFLPVHHMEAHALVVRQAVKVSFPFLCLLISGGHNMLIIAHGVGDYTLLGSTLDDALGKLSFKA